MASTAVAAFALAALIGCAPTGGPAGTSEGRTADVPFNVTAADFQEGAEIPAEHTCDAGDAPISLAWSGAPEGTAELALIMADPDAGGFVHWVVVGIPADATGLAGGQLPSAASAGQTGFGRPGYGGPCPPSGTHRYEFTLYALSAPLGAGAAPTAAQVRSAAADKTLATALLTGRYTRQR